MVELFSFGMLGSGFYLNYKIKIKKKKKVTMMMMKMHFHTECYKYILILIKCIICWILHLSLNGFFFSFLLPPLHN